MNQSTYFCDHCYKEDHNEVKTFFNRYKKTDYTRHIKTKKHLKQCLKIKEDENSILCKECNTLFSPEGYEVHRKRNQEMWDMSSWTRKELKLTCNNIVIDGKRFGSIGQWSKWLDLQENKVPEKRKNKKSINNYNTIELPPPTYEERESEIEEKEKEEKVEEEKSKQNKKKKKLIIIGSEEWKRIYNKEEEVEQELSDYDELCGEKPIFAELCDDPQCSLPQNDEGYSSYHLDKWNIEVCRCCDTTDDENDTVMDIKVI